ncbi:hypothetical protein MLD38_022509 [Melastoma candidum]|uniref:Uncharacterized protein n=1 Tax=Melastoma candidum TaxID=119954 RepID=A0ACB9QIN8_9MYRT|nr:hypothetical protein MLD38_022509 [Melastoma candidum]
MFSEMKDARCPLDLMMCNIMIDFYFSSTWNAKIGGIEPSAMSYSTIIDILGKAGKLDRAAILFQNQRSSVVEIDQVLYQTMIGSYERAGLVAHAKRLLHELRHPNNGNILRETDVTILARAGRLEEVTWVFGQAFDVGMIKDMATFVCMIEVLEKMRGAGFIPDLGVTALVLNAYGKLGSFEKADNSYREMEEVGWCAFVNEVHIQMLSLYGGEEGFGDGGRGSCSRSWGATREGAAAGGGGGVLEGRMLLEKRERIESKYLTV